MEMADGAAFEAPGAPFEFRIAFEKAAAKEILTRVDGDKLGSESHHTPPKWALPGAGILQRRSPGVAFRKPAPSSQGVEVRASLERLDTGGRDKFPCGKSGKQKLQGGK